MTVQPPIPIAIPPGMVMTQSPLAASGRYNGGSWVRFWHGKPQKVGGYINLCAGTILGTPRGSASWSDTSSRELTAVGTEKKLYAVSNVDYVPGDITPWRISTVGLVDPITTQAGSTQVTIAYVGHNASTNDYVDISGAANVDNFSPNGSWPVFAVTDPDHVTIIAPAAAVNTVTGGGAAVTIGFEISPGLSNPAGGYGWGAGTWGAGTWGTPRPSTSLSFSPRTWSFGSFGKVLISCPYSGSLYWYDPTSFPTTRALRIANGPSVCSGVVVTSDLIVVAYGTDYNPATTAAGGAAFQDLMQYWASAQGDYLNWDTTAISGPNGSPSVVNRLQEGTRIIGAADLGEHVTMMWTDTAVYRLQYTGSQFVFNRALVGKECGLMGPNAYVCVGSIAYWVGPHGLFMFSGSVARIPNYEDVSEWIIQNLRPYYTVKAIAWYNQEFNEVWFAYVVNGQEEPTAYVMVNLDDWAWSVGTLPEAMSAAPRFSGYDARPIVVGADGGVYQFDNTLDADGNAIAWSLTSSPVEIGGGVNMIEVDGIAMDMQRQAGDMTATITAYDRTPAKLVAIDAMTQTITPTDNVVDFRVAGRSLSLTLQGASLGGDFRLGVPKVLNSQGGARR